MRFVLQIFTGTYFAKPANVTVEAICQRLREAASLIDVTDVIIGWNTDAALQGAVLDTIHRNGKKAWLWLPVFSEVPKEEMPEPQIGCSGTAMYSSQAADDEDYAFVCPTSRHNRMLPVKIYERYFRRLPYDGVFLDKIRQGSFAGGLARGIGCACERCRGFYKNAGVHFNETLQRVTANPGCLLPIARQDARYHFDDHAVNRYYQAKASCITEAVSLLAAEFRNRGLMVGLDVFAPITAWYAGQDVQALAGVADFVKPMMYLRTNAPAGVPFELAAMNEAIGDEISSLLHALWGAESEDAAGCAKTQIDTLSRWGRAIWPGFEINRVPGVCDSDPAYVRKMARQYDEAGARKAVLSWNLLADAGENLRALASMSTAGR